MVAWRHGGIEAWWHGGMVAWRHGGMEAWRHGGMEAWWHGGMVAWWHGGMVAWRHGGMVAYKQHFLLTGIICCRDVSSEKSQQTVRFIAQNFRSTRFPYKKGLPRTRGCSQHASLIECHSIRLFSWNKRLEVDCDWVQDRYLFKNAKESKRRFSII